MKNRRLIAAIFMVIAVVFGAIFFSETQFPHELESYFKKEYYNQFGPLAISLELLFAGYYLFVGHRRVNFVMALFAFTALFDFLFDLFGLFTSAVPIYATIVFILCAIVCLWLAFTNTYNLGRISLLKAFVSLVLGNAVELFFNYL